MLAPALRGRMESLMQAPWLRSRNAAQLSARRAGNGRSGARGRASGNWPVTKSPAVIGRGKSGNLCHGANRERPRHLTCNTGTLTKSFDELAGIALARCGS